MNKMVRSYLWVKGRPSARLGGEIVLRSLQPSQTASGEEPMPARTITLNLPETLYQRFRQRAEWTHRSLETEILDAVASAASAEEDLPVLAAPVVE